MKLFPRCLYIRGYNAALRDKEWLADHPKNRPTMIS